MPTPAYPEGGTISFELAAGIDCTVRKVSETGALPEIESLISIRDNFTLVISKDGVQRQCHVA